MRKILVIARHEFIATVTRKGYIFAVIGMPLFFLAIAAIPMIVETSGDGSSKERGMVAVIDRAGVVDFDLAAKVIERVEAASDSSSSLGPKKGPQLTSYEDLDRALADLQRRRIQACYVIESDYMTTGRVSVYVRDEGLFSRLNPPGERELYALLRASLVKGRVSEPMLQRVLRPVNLASMKVSERGEVQPSESEWDEVTKLIGPFGMFILLTMAIFFSSGYLLQGMAEDKQNRVIEILFSSVTPEQLLAGKIMGLGAAGLLQVAFYALVLLVPSMVLVVTVQVSVGQLLLSLVYFGLGYLLFASLMAGTGILGSTVQESNQLAAVWTISSIVPLFVLGPISESPHSALARGFSYFPLTAPVTMLLRISLTSVPVIDILISVGSLIVGILLAVRGAAKVFRAASLMYGKRPGLSEILRWLREA